MAELPAEALRNLAERIEAAGADTARARETLGGLLAWLHSNTEATVRELAEAAGIPTTTAHRLITAAEGRGAGQA